MSSIDWTRVLLDWGPVWLLVGFLLWYIHKLQSRLENIVVRDIRTRMQLIEALKALRKTVLETKSV